MNRIIKFRAFIDGEMIEADKLFFNEYAPLSDVLAKEKNLMQYTGLKDKNGKDIFEGDIVTLYIKTLNEDKARFHNCEVIWNELGMWSLKWIDAYINNHPLVPKNYKVIGNIHENKDLLE